jgi:hypothetical protein
MRRGEENDRIVGPWLEPEKPASPVQEVTTKKIVPGIYGIVTVTGSDHIFMPTVKPTADQLREAARILTELADFIGS